MDRVAYVTSLRADGAALAAAARRGLDADVPACPGWTVADLVGHVGIIHAWVTETLRTRAQRRIRREAMGPPPGPDALVDWFEAGVGVVASELAEVDLDEPIWNWAPAPKVAAFWPRRMAQETAVHRWDAESAHGVQAPIDTALAVDGIDEVIRMFLARDAMDNKDLTLGGALHLHTTDADGEWLVEMSDGEVRVRNEHGKGDAAVRAPASDLLLFLWGRTPAASVEVFGDNAVVDRWAEAIGL
jgi:uncharacterized protein (TIGR03083 family)